MSLTRDMSVILKEAEIAADARQERATHVGDLGTSQAEYLRGPIHDEGTPFTQMRF